tara:strand:+ start:367 stop:582 length:216 start_codon:yes stop_codon:yes gene_type:complete
MLSVLTTLLFICEIGGTMDLPTSEVSDTISKTPQLTSACRQFDTPCFPSNAWVQPLSNQVRASGKTLFLAL